MLSITLFSKNKLISGIIIGLLLSLTIGYLFWTKHQRRQRIALIEPLFNQAIAASSAGDLDKAIALYNQVISYDPQCILAYFNSGQLYARQHKWHDACAYFEKVFNSGYSGPNKHVMHAGYAAALEHLNKNQEALNHLNQAITFDPMYAQHFAQRGLLLQKMGALDEAYQDFSKACSFNPEYVKAFINLGNAYRDKEQFEQAINCYQEVMNTMPDYYAPYLCMADVVHLQAKQKKDDELVATAMQLYKKAAELDQTCYQAFHNLGFMHIEQGKVHEALDFFNKALSLKNDDPAMHFGKGVCYLQMGQLEKGWPEYEWRWKGMLSHAHGNIPEWKGQDLHGKTLLFHAEQAFGDAFQFVRYAELIKKKGAKVIVEVHKALKPLICLCPYIEQVITAGEKVPQCDYQLPFLSAPLLFKTTLKTIPQSVPYLFADNNLAKEWSQKIKKFSGFNIGICWECNVQHELMEYKNDKGSQFKVPTPKRSIPLRLFKELSQIPGVKLFSLQKFHTGQEEVQGSRLHSFDDIDSKSGAFMDTAAIMKNLDLVISVDTAIAHLAGGLGVKTWVLLPNPAEWRWLVDRTDSPWYPTMTLFRQEKAGDWNEMMERVAKEIKNLLEEKKEARLIAGLLYQLKLFAKRSRYVLEQLVG